MFLPASAPSAAVFAAPPARDSAAGAVGRRLPAVSPFFTNPLSSPSNLSAMPTKSLICKGKQSLARAVLN